MGPRALRLRYWLRGSTISVAANRRVGSRAADEAGRPANIGTRGSAATVPARFATEGETRRLQREVERRSFNLSCPHSFDSEEMLHQCVWLCTSEKKSAKSSSTSRFGSRRKVGLRGVTWSVRKEPPSSGAVGNLS